MSAQDELTLATALRDYFIEHASLPVKGGAFNLDTLLPEGSSMSLQVTGGQPERTYINGAKKIRQPFTILYRTPITGDNAVKSSVIGTLNSIGAWMDDSEMPYLGDWLTVSTFEQIQTATIVSQDNKFITYQAGYVLGYKTRK